MSEVGRGLPFPRIETRQRKVVHRRGRSYVFMQYMLEASAALLVLAVHTWLKVDDLPTAYRILMLLAAVAMWGIYEGTNVYQQPVDTMEHLWRRLKAWVVLLGVIMLVGFATKSSQMISREVLLTWAVLGFAVQLPVHFLFQHWVRRNYLERSAAIPTLIVGADDLAQRLASHINDDPYLEDRVVGLVATGRNHDAQGVIGTIADLSELIEHHRIRRIYVAVPLDDGGLLRDIHDNLSDDSIDLIWAPDIFEMQILNHRIGAISGIPLISLTETPMSGGAAIVKRIEDVVLSSLILLAVSPVLLLVAMGVKLSSPGPVFYRQTRVSWNGEPFQLYKFRSMPVETDARHGLKWGQAQNKTTTTFGRFIRRTSLDELPQFLNVLKGQMSIVGPRPERDVFVAELRQKIPRYMQKHMVKAGITGWAQIHGWRGDTDLNKRIECDLFYINNWSLMLDIQIIAKTVFAVLNDPAAK